MHFPYPHCNGRVWPRRNPKEHPMSGFTVSRAASAARPSQNRSFAQAFGRAVFAAFRVATTRQELAGMDDRMLRDIGITRADALREAARKPWDHAPTRRD